MVDAERLLRVKGLAKREISRKARLLHHVYTWIRIVGESTSVLHDYPSYGPVVDNICTIYRSGRSSRSGEGIRDNDRPRSGHNARLDDFLRLDPHQSDSDLNIDEVKEHEVGLHDIHLEDSRYFNDTLFQVYGISETWLSLVSQTTRLANILEASKHSKEADAAFFEFLQKRAGRLENMICSFALKTVPDRTGRGFTSSQQLPPDLPAEGQLPSDYMFRALNAALVILFYRRVRNVNPLILQGHVDHVIQALNEFDLALVNHNSQGPGTPWPAFIAGCEAISVTQREVLMSWLKSGFSQCGLYSFSISIDIMKEVWQWQEKNSSSSGVSDSPIGFRHNSPHYWTWVDVSRSKNLWAILF
jgi:arginine metabolism regulation protein II